MRFKITIATLAVSAVALMAGAGMSHAGLLWGSSSAATAAAPKPTATLASASSQGYHDGSYKGPAVRQYYGIVQSEVNIRNGKIASIKILKFPKDYYTSYYINTQALPMLEHEVIQAQSTRVYGVSGATLTTEAFLASTKAALKKATAA